LYEYDSLNGLTLPSAPKNTAFYHFRACRTSYKLSYSSWCRL